MKKEFYSAYARNKLIAEAFYLTGDIESMAVAFCVSEMLCFYIQQ